MLWYGSGMSETKEDPVIRIWMNVAYAGLALQVAAVTAYIPLGIIGPDPSRAALLLWVMPIWIVGVTAVGTPLIGRAFKKWLV
jgi:hypothetical protein